MSWVRLDDAAMDHPKMLKLSADQFRLWIRGLCYCQKHLTDGFIPDEAIKPMMGRASEVKQLCDVRLWEVTEGGFLVHDFLDYNDPRDMVTGRKKRAKERKQAWIDRQHANASEDAVEEHVPEHEDGTVLERVPNTSINPTQPNPTPPVQEEKKQTDTPRVRMSGTNDPEIATRAGDFHREWEKLFSKYRLGATYFGNSQVDYNNCCRLVEKFPNPRLTDLAVVFLNSNEPFIEGSTRSLPVFAARISWCDEQLRKAEARQRRSA